MQRDFLNLPPRTEAELDAEALFESTLLEATNNPPTKTEIHDALGGTDPLLPPRPDARPVTPAMVAKGHVFDT
jgi:hypothetical protein